MNVPRDASRQIGERGSKSDTGFPDLNRNDHKRVTEALMTNTYRMYAHLMLVGIVLLLGLSSAHATFPGRNGRIAFQAQTDAGIQIFTVRPNGQGLQQITHLTGHAVAPDWSPD